MKCKSGVQNGKYHYSCYHAMYFMRIWLIAPAVVVLALVAATVVKKNSYCLLHGKQYMFLAPQCIKRIIHYAVPNLNIERCTIALLNAVQGILVPNVSCVSNIALALSAIIDYFFYLIAFCNQRCGINQVCSAPNTCTCVTGWTGRNCRTRVY